MFAWGAAAGGSGGVKGDVGKYREWGRAGE